jgi:hypothetical protein
VKRRVEDGDHRQLAAERGATGSDAGKARRIVQGRQGLELVNGRDDAVVEHGRRDEARPAVHHAMTDRVDRQALRADPLRDATHRLGVVAQRLGRVHRRAAAGLEAQLRLVGAELLDPAAREPARAGRPAAAAGGLEHAALDRRAAAVDREDVHAVHVQSRTSGMSSRCVRT